MRRRAPASVGLTCLVAAVLTACSSAVAISPPSSANDPPAVAVPAAPLGSDVGNPHPSPLPRNTIPPAPPAPLRIMVVGDSLSAGFYASAADAGYVATLARNVGGVVVQNDSRAGYTVAMDRDLVARAPDTVADVLVVESGTNDAKNKVPPAVTAGNYPSLLTRSQQTAGGHARLVCLGTWMPRTTAVQYDAVLEPLCRQAGGTYLPLRDLYEDGANRGPSGARVPNGIRDAYHPNDAGHRAIADAITAVLR